MSNVKRDRDPSATTESVCPRLVNLRYEQRPSNDWFRRLFEDISTLRAHGSTNELSDVERELRRALGRWQRAGRSESSYDGGVGSGWLMAAQSALVVALERRPSPRAVEVVEPKSLAMRFLRQLEIDRELRSSDLAVSLGVDATQVSRTGKRLVNLLLVTRTSVGRSSYWAITPRGRDALDAAQRKLNRGPDSEPNPAPSRDHDLVVRWGEALAVDKRARQSRRSLWDPRESLSRGLENFESRLALSDRVLASCKSVQEAGRQLDLEVVNLSAPQSPGSNHWSSLRRIVGRDIEADFAAYWPVADAPGWRVQGALQLIGGGVGIVLIEVPFSVDAVRKTTRLRRSGDRQQAARALRELVEEFGLADSVAAIEDDFPDWLSRLVLINYLRTHHQVDAWTAHLCYVAGAHAPKLGQFPQANDDWNQALFNSAERHGVNRDVLDRCLGRVFQVVTAPDLAEA